MNSKTITSEDEHSPVLSVQDLSVSFLVEGQWQKVVRDISFDVHAAETVAIVGESGSGKSVTSLAIMGLLPREVSRTEGKIMLGERSLLSLSSAEMPKVRGAEASMIFQEPMTSLNPLFTIGDQISEAILCHEDVSKKDARLEAIRLLEKVRIPSAANRFDEYPHRFSGGMRQRVMIADEPTTALDVTIQGQILDLIKMLQEEEGTSVLFITHDMGVVAEIADRTVVMFRGNQIETGKTIDIFTKSTEPYTRALLSAVPILGSMKGSALPARFPIMDMETGRMHPAAETKDTVGHDKQPVLEVRNLTKRFDVRSGLFSRLSGRVHAVEDLSFELHNGETLSLVGESGCGKSTAGRSIMRLIEPNSGEILVNGENVLGYNGKAMRKLRESVQMIFQDPFASLNPRMTVGAAIAEPYLEHGFGTKQQARELVADLLEKVGLDAAMARRYPHEFSGGQRQRVCIARTLALDPKVIIADESVSALDVSIKAQVINLMLDLQESLNIAFLFISHDMAVVERISHQVAVMYLGEIVEIGPREAIFKNPQHPYTRKLIKAVPVPDPTRLGMRRVTNTEDLRSPIRPLDYIPEMRQFIEASPGHLYVSQA